MIEYIYKGFMIAYKVVPSPLSNNSFQANGSVTYLLNKPKSFKAKKFQTEYATHLGAEHEIRKLIENYVNLELKNFYDMKNLLAENQQVAI